MGSNPSSTAKTSVVQLFHDGSCFCDIHVLESVENIKRRCFPALGTTKVEEVQLEIMDGGGDIYIHSDADLEKEMSRRRTKGEEGSPLRLKAVYKNPSKSITPESIQLASESPVQEEHATLSVGQLSVAEQLEQIEQLEELCKAPDSDSTEEALNRIEAIWFASTGIIDDETPEAEAHNRLAIPASTYGEPPPCDVLFVGAGCIGLWTAVQMKILDPQLSIVILEKDSKYLNKRTVQLLPRSMANWLAIGGEGASSQNHKALNEFCQSLPHNLRNNWLEDALTKMAQHIGIFCIVEPVSDVREMIEKYNPVILIGSDGRRSIVRDQWMVHGQFETQQARIIQTLAADELIQTCVQVRYEVEGEGSKLTWNERFSVAKRIPGASLVVEYLGEKFKDTKTGKVITSVFFLFVGVATSEFVTLSNGGKPFHLPLPSTIDPKLRAAIMGYLEAKATLRNEKRVVGSETVLGIPVRMYLSNTFAEMVPIHNASSSDELPQIPTFLVGDAALGIPFQRNINNGFISGTRLAVLITDQTKTFPREKKKNATDDYCRFILSESTTSSFKKLTQVYHRFMLFLSRGEVSRSKRVRNQTMCFSTSEPAMMPRWMQAVNLDQNCLDRIQHVVQKEFSVFYHHEKDDTYFIFLDGKLREIFPKIPMFAFLFQKEQLDPKKMIPLYQEGQAIPLPHPIGLPFSKKFTFLCREAPPESLLGRPQKLYLCEKVPVRIVRRLVDGDAFRYYHFSWKHVLGTQSTINGGENGTSGEMLSDDEEEEEKRMKSVHEYMNYDIGAPLLAWQELDTNKNIEEGAEDVDDPDEPIIAAPSATFENLRSGPAVGILYGVQHFCYFHPKKNKIFFKMNGKYREIFSPQLTLQSLFGYPKVYTERMHQLQSEIGPSRLGNPMPTNCCLFVEEGELEGKHHLAGASPLVKKKSAVSTASPLGPMHPEMKPMSRFLYLLDEEPERTVKRELTPAAIGLYGFNVDKNNVAPLSDEQLNSFHSGPPI